MLSEKSSDFSVKTTIHIHRLFEKFGFDEVFGRSAVMEILELKSSGASKILSNLVQAVNIALVQRNWLLGYRIASEELQGNERAEYGTELIKRIDSELWKRLA